MRLHMVPVYFSAAAAGVHVHRGFPFEDAYAPRNYSYPQPNPSYCCGALEAAGFGSRVEYPSEGVYEDRIDTYWSDLAQLRPWCLIQPISAEEVSKIVTTLVAANHVQECRFAVRSGGHTPWAGAANIADGVTIDLGLMNSTIYHSENSTAAIQPGARWGSVYATLDKLGISSPGGRSGVVGAGGLILGGGISFFSARKGFVCDNIANFEVVLASGEIVNANSKENPDLWQVLKGGSINFGIVTRYDMMVFENGNLWGGLVFYPNATAPQQARAFANFTDNIEKDPNASVMLFASYSPSSPGGGITMFNSYDYTKPVKRPAAFDEFFAIPGNFTDTTRITNMTDLTAQLKAPDGYRQVMVTCTFENDEHVLLKALELFADMVEQLKLIKGNWTAVSQAHPVPKLFSQHSIGNGGNVLGLDRSSSNLILFMSQISWKDAEKDLVFEAANKQLIGDVSEFARSIGKGNEWVYLDYADKDQDPLGSYGPDNVAKMRAVAAKYDPDGVFQKLVPGGFKISKVED